MATIPYEPGETGFTFGEVKDLAHAFSKTKIGKRVGRGFKHEINKLGSRKKARKFKVRDAPVHVGEPVGRTLNSKRNNQLDLENQNRSSRTLYSSELTLLSQGTDVDQRLRGIAHITGIEIAYTFFNQSASNTPMYLNCAVVAPKHRNAGVTFTNFFRGYGNSRGQDFDTTLVPLEFHCRPINTDNYHVLMHKRYTVNTPGGTGFTTGTGPTNWITKKHWIKINRKFTWDTTTTVCDQPILFAYWFDFINATGGSAVVSNAATMSLMHSTHFKDLM